MNEKESFKNDFQIIHPTKKIIQSSFLLKGIQEFQIRYIFHFCLARWMLDVNNM